ncbi:MULTISPECIES: hypothetical protein [unclassified Curtobacterium]|uniref:hypothetical protein n=1 Tax=unclassified Curtobacterium TaxID=257496 RepID=UPI000F45FD66|nr:MULTISPECIES: hypothetical protein [unclassified Curtobacterium]ROQ04060.1 hypothetical protein EDF41_3623 [Curtobacterium sp. PhB171]ROQ19325.1 hypothetical protein EDF40_3565 [Curtobacterium sp. PhB170]ROS32773.1 hypothetical protein EDF25_3433 [Curtobacterium sp. PhB131]ROS64336.1 hypothetical protein EDF30_3558 [Curtobacterium sp. PhB141]
MSSSDAQPPLSRRQARERERAAAAGSQPATPPPTVAAPTESTEPRPRPGSHVAPAPGGPAQSSAPASAATATSAPTGTPASAPSVPVTSVPAAGVSPFPPASATEIVPGSGGLTRRQIRQQRAAENQAVLPVPLQNPTPQSSDRTVEDVLGSVDTIEPTSAPRAADAPSGSETPTVLDEAAVAQATEADGSPDALEPLDEAAAHAEEPRRHRSTWSPPADDGDDASDAQPGYGSTDAAPAATPSDQTGTDQTSTGQTSTGQTSTDAIAPVDAAAPEHPSATSLPGIPDGAPSTPAVFPLSLDPEDDDTDHDTNEVPIPEPARTEPPKVPASFQRPAEPKPMTTAFEPPVGHWSQQAHGSNDAEVHDDSTGTRRIAVTDTNAIILPNSALADPTGALNATGEVILTGSIDLPASLSSTGSHRPIDGAEVDRLLEQHDEQPETDASPVRASRAVSSHTSTRQVVLAAAKPKESRTPLILGVTVGAVGVAAAAVIIVALVTTHTFGG